MNGDNHLSLWKKLCSFDRPGVIVWGEMQVQRQGMACQRDGIKKSSEGCPILLSFALLTAHTTELSVAN